MLGSDQGFDQLPPQRSEENANEIANALNKTHETPIVTKKNEILPIK